MMLIALQVLLSGSRSIRKTFLSEQAPCENESE